MESDHDMGIDRFEDMRRAMVASQLRTNAVDDPRVIDAMARVPREDFVPEGSRQTAYADLSIPLGGGRAMNSPMVVGRLLNEADIRSTDHVLVVGCGSGYALAAVALLAGRATGLESDAALAARAQELVPSANIVAGPLSEGDPDNAPYDVIVIDGAVEQVPDALIGQLKPDGTLATAIVERGVTRLAVGRRAAHGFGLRTFADADAVILPGFAPAKAFVF